MARIRMVPGTRLIDYLLPGPFIVDRDKWEDGSPFQCMENLCFHPGQVGAIDREEAEEMVIGGKAQISDFEEPVASRVRLFIAASKSCPVTNVEAVTMDALEERFRCMCASMKQRGLDVC